MYRCSNFADHRERFNMKKIAESLIAFLGKGEAVLREKVLKRDGAVTVYPSSVHAAGYAAVFLCRDDESRFLVVAAAGMRDTPEGFEGEKIALASSP